MGKSNKQFRVIVAGGRDFCDYLYLKNTLDYLLQNIQDEIIIVSGMAKGADHLGELYGIERGYKILYFSAEWDKFGKSAGYIRNEQMARNADALVAFWNGKSHGTRHMIQVAKRQQLMIRVKNY